MKVRTMDSSGHLVDVSQTPGLPRNAQEFIEQLKRQIKRDNSDSKLESAGEIQLAGASGVRVCYTSGSTRVLKVTRFGSITTFQFACEAPAAAWAEVEPTFNRMIESFTLA